jgi:outer membrane protein assembly factor BamE (lipoprotein component of BamABCDE complex)
VQDRRILAVYLDDSQQVRDVAEYGLRDGKVFDYLSRRTRTGGSDLAFVSQLLGGLFSPSL